MKKAGHAKLGGSLRERREAVGWSQARLAEAVSVSPNYIGVLERGEKLPTLETLAALADALGVSSAELLGGSEPAKDPWLDEVMAAARAIPAEHRALVLAFVRTAATVRSGAVKKRAGRPRKRK